MTRRQAEAQKVRALRRELARARAALRARMRRLRAAAQRYRKSARRRVRAWFRAELAKLRAERDRRLGEIRLTIARRAAELKERAAVARAEKRLGDHREILAALRAVRGDRAGRTAEARAEVAARARDAREQSREDVIREIEHHDRALLPVWEKVGATIKATARQSRAEAFFKWVHDNPEEATRIQADAGEAEALRLWQARQRAEHAIGLASIRARLHREHGGDLVEVWKGRTLMRTYRYDPHTWRLGGAVFGAPLRAEQEEPFKAAARAELASHAAVPF